MHSELNTRANILGKIIFASRWLQLPIYLGLIVVQGYMRISLLNHCII